MADKRRVVVTGAGGFIGHHLVSFLKNEGYWVRGVDLKLPEFSATDADEFELLDLRERASCDRAVRNVHEVYALAADMGGMGFISAHHAQILHNNALINLHTLEAAQDERRQALPLHVFGLRLPRVPAGGRERHAAEGRRRLSGRSRRTPTAGRS